MVFLLKRTVGRLIIAPVGNISVLSTGSTSKGLCVGSWASRSLHWRDAHMYEIHRPRLEL
jgi:hypothetical protein